MPSFKHIHGLKLWLPVYLHDVGSSLRLNVDPGLNLSPIGSALTVYLWLSPTWLNYDVSLSLTICELRALSFVSSLYV